MTNQFNQLQEKRRSIYALGKNVKEDKQTLIDLIEKTIELSPSAFNSQTVRAVIAFG
jgi:predicted oxidoreductase (fatty acid repression mutant protein)